MLLTSFPSEHSGIPYTEMLKTMVSQSGARVYLEIGVETGKNLSNIVCEKAIGVDPAFALNCNVMNGKLETVLHQCTSDDFFKMRVHDNKIDFAFLDGLHLYEYLLRDFFNTERAAHSQSIIVIHDCMPLNHRMAGRDVQETIRIDVEAKHYGWWTGDVWKIVPILQKYRPDLSLTFLDCPPTGLLVVQNLDPTSKVLESSYDAIVEEFDQLENSELVSCIYGRNCITSSVDFSIQAMVSH